MRVLVPWPHLVASMQLPEVETVLWNIDDATEPPAADILVTERAVDPAHRSRVARIQGLRHVHLLSIGYEWVLDHLPEGVSLTNSKGAVEDATAELCLALTLASLRELPTTFERQKTQDWQRLWTSSLHGSKVMILGTGGVGTAIADRIKPFKPSQIHRVGSTARTGEDGEPVLSMEQAFQLLGSVDVVICALPHTPATEGLIDKNFLQKMADGSLLVNVGRGAIVRTEDLITELNSGRICAALDVMNPEPLPVGHPLWSAKNCIVTPHMGGDTQQFLKLVSDMAIEQVQRLAAGDEPFNVVV